MAVPGAGLVTSAPGRPVQVMVWRVGRGAECREHPTDLVDREADHRLTITAGDETATTGSRPGGKVVHRQTAPSLARSTALHLRALRSSTRRPDADIASRGPARPWPLPSCAAGSGRQSLAADASRPPSLLTGTPRATAGQGGSGGSLSPQLAAFFTSAPILVSSSAVSFVRAK